MVGIRITPHESGPMFSGRGSDALMRQCEDEIEQAGAEEAERLIHFHLARVLRNPTGFYRSNIGIRGEAGDKVVDDNNVVYGPWLEGTGSMNFPRTRFKGYSTFRRVGQLMERQIGRIGSRILDRYARRL